MRVRLSLDCASHTGVALIYNTGHIYSTVWCLTRPKKGPRQVKGMTPLPSYRLRRRLERLDRNHHITDVVYEDAFGRGLARDRHVSLQTIVCHWAMDLGIPYTAVQANHWKKKCLGKTNAKHAEYMAAAQKKWPQVRMWKDDQAAALWLANYMGWA